MIHDDETQDEVRTQYKDLFVPDQMAPNGSFPKELARTKPYSYSIFNFDTMAMLCQSLQRGRRRPVCIYFADGRGICKGAAFLYPYLRDKTRWPYKKDVEHFDSLPVRSPGYSSLVWPASTKDYLQLWTH